MHQKIQLLICGFFYKNTIYVSQKLVLMIRKRKKSAHKRQLCISIGIGTQKKLCIYEKVKCMWCSY